MGIVALLETFSREELLMLFERILDKSPNEWTRQIESASFEMMQAAGRTLELLSSAPSSQLLISIQQCKYQTMTSLAEGPPFAQLCEIVEFWMKGLKKGTAHIASAWSEVAPNVLTAFQSILETKPDLESIIQALGRLSAYSSDLPNDLRTMLGAFLTVAFDLDPTKKTFAWILKSAFCSPETVNHCLTRLTSLWESDAMKLETYMTCLELCKRQADLQWTTLSALARRRPLLPAALIRLLERFCRSHAAELNALLAVQWPAVTQLMADFLHQLWTAHYEYVRVPTDWSPGARKKFQQDLELRRKNRSYGEFGLAEVKPTTERLELVGALEAWQAWRQVYRQMAALGKASKSKEAGQLEENVLGLLFGPQHIWAKVATVMATETSDLSQTAARIFREIEGLWTDYPYWLKFPKPNSRDLSPKRAVKSDSSRKSGGKETVFRNVKKQK
jgi:hypothetical protein